MSNRVKENADSMRNFAKAIAHDHEVGVNRNNDIIFDANHEKYGKVVVTIRWKSYLFDSKDYGVCVNVMHGWDHLTKFVHYARDKKHLMKQIDAVARITDITQEDKRMIAAVAADLHAGMKRALRRFKQVKRMSRSFIRGVQHLLGEKVEMYQLFCDDDQPRELEGDLRARFSAERTRDEMTPIINKLRKLGFTILFERTYGQATKESCIFTVENFDGLVIV